MEKKTLFKPGDLVKSFTGQLGLVISRKTLDKIKGKVTEGRRPGHFFAAGCPESIDYLLKVPVFFEDGTYDIMKTMNIKKASESAEGWTKGDLEEKRAKLEEMLENM